MRSTENWNSKEKYIKVCNIRLLAHAATGWRIKSKSCLFLIELSQHVQTFFCGTSADIYNRTVSNLILTRSFNPLNWFGHVLQAHQLIKYGVGRNQGRGHGVFVNYSQSNINTARWRGAGAGKWAQMLAMGFNCQEKPRHCQTDIITPIITKKGTRKRNFK